MFYRHERLALFIDGSNLYSASRALGFDIDYKKLKDEFSNRGELVRAYYYTVLAENDDYSPVKPLVDWLNYNGYSIVSKPAKEYIDASGKRRFKGKIEVELCVDALEIAAHVQHIVLFSGDGDFKPLVAALQRMGIRVTIVSTVQCSPPMVADDLRRQADKFIELADLEETIGRPQREDPIEHQNSPIPPYISDEIPSAGKGV